ncbi:Acetyl-CoA acetyltransferase, cytosolic [Trichoplax sp. H2]|nr:Acetyl-CoA acetyltransferase, cytosolic [Trichoplax sp. H2]|eukprot:RDD43613.1 Acetyl-CoA acetyltransferase, cytosolic [Trichoplax sp. H2]
MAENDIVIASAARTAIGAFNGSLQSQDAYVLGGIAIQEALARANVSPNDVSEVIMGQVLQGGTGPNGARRAAAAAKIPFTSTAYTINMQCASGLRAIALGAQSISAGDSNIIVAGGQESMTRTQHCIHMRKGVKLGEAKMEDMILKDSLIDGFHSYHMGMTAENIAKQWNISREEQDKYAVLSQNRAEAAQKSNFFDKEIVPVKIADRKGEIIVNKDEHPRHGTNIQSLGKLRPAFLTDGTGTVTAGNASGINDGAAAVVLMTMQEAKNRNIEPLARIVSSAQTGLEPSIMGMGPVSAVNKALERAGWTLDEVDLFELNEAFAAQACGVLKELKVDLDKVNVCGGAIALGHPIGCSGCRILVTLIYSLIRLGKTKGVAALCAGGGMGSAMCIEINSRLL